MSTDVLIEEYIKGKLELDMDKLDNFDKIKYHKTKTLLDDLLKGINSLMSNLNILKKIREQIKKVEK